jgi:protein O-GlcNAc transferase
MRATIHIEPPPKPLWIGERYQHKKIRIAYLSADFHDHATAHLMAGLFDAHDRKLFEITAFSFGPDKKDKMRERLMAAFDDFIDIRSIDDNHVARMIREREIDIAIDLKGFTKDARVDIFAMRPAPIQVNFIGYPGTMGADFIDYIISDRVIIPPEMEQLYSEKVVCLPDTYQPNDDKREISQKPLLKAELGLPEKAFVFCCFNNNYKITPDIFNIWMKLLLHVEGSVLWLLDGGATVASNLRAEAKKRGVSADRIIFAPKMKLEDHLVRHQCADLFLDTMPYNAHTTASDALWAGLPILTCLGQTFASRVAGSLLTAAGMPELITHSLDEYEKMALRLAREPQTLAAIKAKLSKNRDTCALFDTKRYTRNLEAAYIKMWEIAQRGGKPEVIIT